MFTHLSTFLHSDTEFTLEFGLSTLSHTTKLILDSSKLKEFADDNFKFDENGRGFCQRVENTVGKGEIPP